MQYTTLRPTAGFSVCVRRKGVVTDMEPGIPAIIEQLDLRVYIEFDEDYQSYVARCVDTGASASATTIEEAQRDYVTCVLCGQTVKTTRYDGHGVKAHGMFAGWSKLSVSKLPRRVAGGMLECPSCKFRVPPGDFIGHQMSAHKPGRSRPRIAQGGLVSPR